MSAQQLGPLMKGIAAALRPLFQDINKRLDLLESRSIELRYCGVWQSGRDYKAGNMATHSGGLWHCNQATTEKPGQSNDWTLAVKSGDR